jgi:hypothetical protein
MAIKAEELALMAEGKGCLGKAADDEPLFILRAKDPAAAFIVRVWCQLAWQAELHEPEKIEDAKVLADRMEAWRMRNVTAAPLPWKKG